MNKFLFYLLLALLFSQCFSDNDNPEDDVTECTGGTKDDCSDKTLRDSLYKCVFKEEEEEDSGTCSPVLKTCEEANSLTGKDCTKLTPEEEEGAVAVCINGESGCVVAKTCEDISLSTDVTKELCSTFDSGDYKCVPNGKSCTLKKLCNKASKTADHDCGYFALENEENECVSKEGSEEECEEVTKIVAEERAAKSLCLTKTSSTECGLILNGNILIECEWKEEPTPEACILKARYATCTSASSLSTATNEDCSKLAHEEEKYCIKGVSGCLGVSNCAQATGSTISDEACKSIEVPAFQECKKGTNGCELKNKLCNVATIVNKEENCEKLDGTSDGNICYYDGENCAEANSCTSVAETKLNDEEKMKHLCALFNSETQCVPDGKKCK